MHLCFENKALNMKKDLIGKHRENLKVNFDMFVGLME